MITTIVASMTMMLIASITAAATTPSILDNPFTNTQKAYAQLPPTHLGGPGNDNLRGTANSVNSMYGDAYPSLTNTQGGNDRIRGGSGTRY